MVVIENGFGKGLPPVDRKNPDNLETPLQVGLSALAESPGIVDNFSQALTAFVSKRRFPRELFGIFKFGVKFNRVGWAPHEIIELGYRSLEIDVFIPLRGGENSATASEYENSRKATLLGITGARRDADSSEVTFEGFAIPAGLEIKTDTAVIVFINSKTGRAEVDPKFAQAMHRATNPSF